MENFEYEMLENINDSIEKLNDKITNISDILVRILGEQRKTNVMYENIGDEISFKNEIICRTLSDIDMSKFDDNIVLVVGFPQKDVEALILNYANGISANVSFANGIENTGDLSAVLTSFEEDDVILFNCEDFAKSSEITNGILQAICYNTLTLRIGRGAAAQSIDMELPKLKYIFYDSTVFNIPKSLREKIELCIWNESDKKGV